MFQLFTKNSNYINYAIKKSINESMPFSIGKIGNVEAVNLENFLNGIYRVKGIELYVNAGIFVKNDSDFIDWSEKIIASILNQNYLLDWKLEDKPKLKKLVQKQKKFKNFKGLEPFDLGSNGWHYSLEDKKLLCISPFSKSVIKQSNIFDKLWKNASISEVKTVSTPHSDAITNNNPTPWKEKLEKILNEIHKSSFDVATVGCGGLSLIICDEIKKMGKTAIHLGGANQILFGIKGRRWDKNFKNYEWYGTKYWIRPLQEETPVNKNLIEKGAYW